MLNPYPLLIKMKKQQCVFNMSQNRFKTFALKVKMYAKENWGAPFIAGFMLILISAAFFLTAGLYSLADTVAVYAYYALVAGVLLQLVCFLKYSRKSNEAEAVQ